MFSNKFVVPQIAFNLFRGWVDFQENIKSCWWTVQTFKVRHLIFFKLKSQLLFYNCLVTVIFRKPDGHPLQLLFTDRFASTGFEIKSMWHDSVIARGSARSEVYHWKGVTTKLFSQFFSQQEEKVGCQGQAVARYQALCRESHIFHKQWKSSIFQKNFLSYVQKRKPCFCFVQVLFQKETCEEWMEWWHCPGNLSGWLPTCWIQWFLTSSQSSRFVQGWTC